MGRIIEPVSKPTVSIGRKQSSYCSPSPEELLMDILAGGRQTPCCGNQCGSNRAFWMPIFPLYSAKLHPEQPWVKVIDLRGFDPNDITVNTQDGKLKIYARHEERKGEDVDTIEKVRLFDIPESVEKSKMACFIDSNGSFVIKAPLKRNSVKLGQILVQKNGVVKRNQKLNGSEGKNPDTPPEAATHTASSLKEHDYERNENENKIQVDTIIENNPTEAKEISIQTQNDRLKKTCTPQTSDSQSERSQSPTDSDDFYFIQPNQSIEESNETTTLETSSVPCYDQVSHFADNVVPGKELVTQTMGVTTEETDCLSEVSEYVNEKGQTELRITLKLIGCSKERISVSCVDNTLVVICKSNAADDAGFTKRREIHKEFPLPLGARNTEAKARVFNNDDVLIITVPIEKPIVNERNIPINNVLE